MVEVAVEACNHQQQKPIYIYIYIFEHHPLWVLDRTPHKGLMLTMTLSQPPGGAHCGGSDPRRVARHGAGGGIGVAARGEPDPGRARFGEPVPFQEETLFDAGRVSAAAEGFGLEFRSIPGYEGRRLFLFYSCRKSQLAGVLNDSSLSQNL